MGNKQMRNGCSNRLKWLKYHFNGHGKILNGYNVLQVKNLKQILPTI